MPNIKEKLHSYFESNSNILIVYLFGSAFENHTGPLSDYDFGILTVKPMDYETEFRIAYEISQILDFYKIHIVNLNRAFPALKYNVINGINIFMLGKKTLVDFETKTLNEYFDFLPVLKQQRKELAYG